MLLPPNTKLSDNDTVALAAGLHASRLDGSPLVYNEADTWLPDFFVCRPEYTDAILHAIWGRDPR